MWQCYNVAFFSIHSPKYILLCSMKESDTDLEWQVYNKEIIFIFWVNYPFLKLSKVCKHNMLLVLSVWTDMSSLFCVTVLGGLESRGVLRKISDMLEIIMKRIDTLSKMSNSSESHRLEELSSALHRCSFTFMITSQQWHSSSQVSLAAFKSRRDNRIYKMNAHERRHNVLIASYLYVYLCDVSAWFNWKCSSSRLEDKLIKSVKLKCNQMRFCSC